jgi:thioredoxin 1
MADRKQYLILAVALVAMLVVPVACSPTTSSENPLDEALANGKPTLAGFVGQECACNDMKPILKELATEYDGRCNIVIIDVRNHKDLARQYEIMLTPTQVLFGSSGQEITTHIGYWPKEEVVDQLEEIGVA